MPAGKYTVNEVEERTGVPAATLRQWERRYGVPKPERTDSGYRLYSDEDVRRIRTLKSHVDDGVPASRAAEMVREEPRSDAGPRPLSDLQRKLVDALTELDEPRAERVIAEAHALHSVEDVVLDLLHGTMVEVGERWHDGAISTTTEHFASSFVQGRLRQIMAFSGHGRGGPAVIIACAPLDQHDIGAMMLAVMLRRYGFTVYYVGANTPVEDLASMAHDVRPAAVLISASSIESVHQLLQKREHLRGIAPVLALGGNGFNGDPRRAEMVGGVYLADNVREAVERLQALLARPTAGASA
jgi:MerR family transcriptional regulator, light-induced transcriptional regulator